MNIVFKKNPIYVGQIPDKDWIRISDKSGKFLSFDLKGEELYLRDVEEGDQITFILEPFSIFNYKKKTPVLLKEVYDVYKHILENLESFNTARNVNEKPSAKGDYGRIPRNLRPMEAQVYFSKVNNSFPYTQIKLLSKYQPEGLWATVPEGEGYVIAPTEPVLLTTTGDIISLKPHVLDSYSFNRATGNVLICLQRQ